MPLLESARSSFQKKDITFKCSPPDASNDLLSGPARLLTQGSTEFGSDLLLFSTDQGFLLRWEEKCDFLVLEDGHCIQCGPLPGTDLLWVRNILYSVVLSFALHVQGVSNFHASAVALPTGAVGFLASPGAGKSTLAASFAAAGHPMLCDDVLPLQGDSEGFLAFPGFPYVSLSSQSMDNVFGRENGPSRLVQNGEKQRISMKEQGMAFSWEPVPLKKFYLLDGNQEANAVKIERISRVETINRLLENTHCLPLLPPAILQSHLNFLARLTAKVPVYWLVYPPGLHHVPSIMKSVLEHDPEPPLIADLVENT